MAEDLLLGCVNQLRRRREIGITSTRASNGRIEYVLRNVQALADEQINAIDFNLVPIRWLALYTDVSLVRALDLLWRIPELDVMGADRSIASEAVRLLDMALVVAGGCGKGRSEWIHRTIRYAQRYLSAPVFEHDITSYDRSAKRRKTEISANANPSILFAPTTVPVLPRPPTVSAYATGLSGQPFVIRGFTTSSNECPPWSAISKWSDATYLLSSVGEGRHVPVEIGSAYSDSDWGQRIVPLRDFLNRAGFLTSEQSEPHRQAEEPPMYLAQHSLFRQFPQLEADLAFPDYVWSAPSAPVDYPMYKPPSNQEGVIVNVWIGSGSGKIVSPAHTVS